MADQDVNELFIGMVGALGSDLDFVIDKLSLTLESLGYEIERISISSLMHKLDDYSDIPTIPEDVRIDEYMNAGNKLRENTKK